MTRGDRSNVTAIVLAGGRSTRFGGDKLAADLDGTSVLARTVAAVASIAEGVVVSVAELPEDLLEVDVPVAFVQDRERFAGPLAALADVLGGAADEPSSLALVVGGDMPQLVPAVLTAMLDRLAVGPQIEAIILETPGESHRQVLPLAIRVAPATREARAAIARGERSLRALVDRLATLELPEREWRRLDFEAATLLDVDTPEDLEPLRSARAGDDGPG